MMDDGCCHFTVSCVPFSVNGRWFIVYVLCASIFRLLSIDTKFQTLRLKAEDSSGRQHILTIKLKSKVRQRSLLRAHTVYCKDWIIFTLKIIPHQTEYSAAWCWPTAYPNPNRPTSPNAHGMFNLLIANQWFTSAPLNLGQTGEDVERHDNPLWLRCSTDKTSPHRPQHDGKLFLYA